MKFSLLFPAFVLLSVSADDLPVDRMEMDLASSSTQSTITMENREDNQQELHPTAPSSSTQMEFEKGERRVVTSTPSVISSLQDGETGSEEEDEDTKKYRLMNEVIGNRTLRSVHGSFLRAPDDEWKVDLVNRLTTEAHWEIHPWFGMVGLMAARPPIRYVRAREDGSVGMGGSFFTGTNWKLLKHEDASWSFGSVYGGWLCAGTNGSVYIAKDSNDPGAKFILGDWQENQPDESSGSAPPLTLEARNGGDQRIGSDEEDDFTAPLTIPERTEDEERASAHKALQNRTTIKSVHGTFVRALLEDHTVDLVRRAPRGTELWDVTPWLQGQVQFGVSHSSMLFLHARGDGIVGLYWKFLVGSLWTAYEHEDGSWSFKSRDGGWLSARKNGTVSTIRDNLDASVKFWLEYRNGESPVITSTATMEEEVLGTSTDASEDAIDYTITTSPSPASTVVLPSASATTTTTTTTTVTTTTTTTPNDTAASPAVTELAAPFDGKDEGQTSSFVHSYHVMTLLVTVILIATILGATCCICRPRKTAMKTSRSAKQLPHPMEASSLVLEDASSRNDPANAPF